MRVEEGIEIDRPVEEVFAYVANPQNLLEWSGLVIEVKDARVPLSEGDTFTTVGKFLGRRFETPFERISIEPNRRYTDRAKGGPVPNRGLDLHVRRGTSGNAAYAGRGGRTR